ncbi:MAG: PLP-dependent aminotransferase family protein [Alphaproteobacteria bacterium]|nr:PLP-dependent aminotransferase family protein [Rhodospirillaceae bacterium]MDG2479483.1 PLP-dependent aminotransferase family protein [Alphaproteobacteria bacterium]MBT6203974.1 PLP-dependent aminotransferase family protein [Rhodospirillaceae bacterium]MBT6509851.1 PLP-dependent aminotransferase family protein [Rhodospirillaceae bacterium]MBT7612270.1 PLP-dependent aminotransferase family protein [Rhodospirillaceae bacterium]
MRDSMFHIERLETVTLQNQIRERLVEAMLTGQLPAGSPIPSTRAMAKRLNVSRNTVMIAYQALASDGYLEARERSGFYVSPELRDGMVDTDNEGTTRQSDTIDWSARLRRQPSVQTNIAKPRNWHDYPYPFIYGQADDALFPVADWRDCMRQAMSRKWLDAWTDDQIAEDDPMLVEQLRQRVLTRRGIMAAKDEILVTMGAQNALYILSSLLVKPDTPVAIEDPGYPDVRNIFRLMSSDVRPVPVDNDGARVDRLGDASMVYVTPSHQAPTNATMSLQRRHDLLAWAGKHDALVIEDDYEFETNYLGSPTPALKSLNGSERVLYVGSLSKSLMPGLRMGFMVGPRDLIAEARALRRLMLRHPPGNNQRVVALFLALGHHDALVARLHRTYSSRWKTMGKALEQHFPGWYSAPTFGGTSFWLEGPETLDTRRLTTEALEDGIVIEPGEVYFAEPERGHHHIRLGFSSIPEERIEPGIERLAAIAKKVIAAGA